MVAARHADDAAEKWVLWLQGYDSFVEHGPRLLTVEEYNGKHRLAGWKVKEFINQRWRVGRKLYDSPEEAQADVDAIMERVK